MNDPADELRRDIKNNTMNLGTLGRFIRVEHVYNFLDMYTITSKDEAAIKQISRIDKIRHLLYTSSDARRTLKAIYEVVYP